MAMLSSLGRYREQVTSHMHCDGRITEKAKASGKARGYADVGTVGWTIEPQVTERNGSDGQARATNRRLGIYSLAKARTKGVPTAKADLSSLPSWRRQSRSQ